MIAQTLVVAFILLGVIIILLAIHFGADCLFGKTNASDEEKLRSEVRSGGRGISEHNIFYRFFFRNR